MPQIPAAFFLPVGNKNAELAQNRARPFHAHWARFFNFTVNTMRAFRTFLRFLFLPLLAFPLLALADPVYTMRVLPSNFQATSLNNKGQVAGTLNGDNGEIAIWSASGLLNLSVHKDSWGSVGINNRGDVATTLYGASYRGAAVWSSGRWQYLKPLLPDMYFYSAAFAINDNGAVAGAGHVMIGDDGSAFIYRDGHIEFTGTLSGGAWTEPTAISNTGYVAGFGSTYVRDGPYDTHHAFLYKDGILQDLGSLGGYHSAATAINNAGEVVGWSERSTDDATRHPFLFVHGNMIDLGALFGPSGEGHAYGINNSGTVVGDSQLALDSFATHAFIYERNRMTDLNTMVDAANGWELVSARAINDKGEILAWACRAKTCAFVLLTSSGQNAAN
jgi:probable HAF family extracellular repeat protein